jgi:hypothetical protein
VGLILEVAYGVFAVLRPAYGTFVGSIFAASLGMAE